jgi:hypothetical protein
MGPTTRALITTPTTPNSTKNHPMFCSVMPKRQERYSENTGGVEL